MTDRKARTPAFLVLMAEEGRRYPVWSSYGGPGAAGLRDLGVSDALLRELEEWQADWLRIVGEGGIEAWDLDLIKCAARLQSRLRDVIPERIPVFLDF